MKIVIDGLIGAGKSTQAELISTHYGLNVVKEPINDWPLNLFYSDPRRWGFLMQTAVLSSFSKLKNSDGIFERSPQSSKEVFWKNLVNSGTVTESENETFTKLFDALAWVPDVTIFISTPPINCWRHIQARGQTGDSTITMDYLENLDMYYQEYIKTYEGTVHIVDGDQRVEKVTEQIVKILDHYINKNTPAYHAWIHQSDVYM